MTPGRARPAAPARTSLSRLVCDPRISCACLPLVLALSAPPSEEHRPVRVQHADGEFHSRLVLTTLDGTAIADGSLAQTVEGERVTAHLVFHFNDGSAHDETTVFTEREVFRLVSDHVVQNGPSFPPALDLSIDVPAGRIRVGYTDEGGTRRTKVEHEDLPPDLANGMIPILLMNLAGDVPRALSCTSRPTRRHGSSPWT